MVTIRQQAKVKGNNNYNNNNNNNNQIYKTRHDKQRRAVTSLECTVYEPNCLNAI